MAILEIDLLANPDYVIDSGNASDGDVLHITALGNSSLTVDGVDVTIDSIVGIQAASSPTFAVQNSGNLTIDNGLLNASLLSSMTFEVYDTSSMFLDASTLDLGTLSGLLTNYSVAYSGPAGTGTFTYSPPTLSVLGGLTPVTFDVTGMQATDEFIVQGRTLELDTTLLGPPESAYYDGILHLTSDGGLLTQSVNVEVPMTADEAAEFFANQATYLSADTFIFPGAAVACFVAGTPVATVSGDVPVERLRVGKLVMTMDNGYQPIRWIGCRQLDAEALDLRPELRPIRIRAHALGRGRPDSDILVSPQHRVLISNAVAMRMFNEKEVLIAAKHLLASDGIEIAEDVRSLTYWHFFFDRHQIVFSCGAATESLYLGPEALKTLPSGARREIFALFPDMSQYTAARPLIAGRRARRLSERISKNSKHLVDF
ncbi:Hint domain-containing protein [Salipiger sp. P9]|uniref:Hint domain-containing protein n=1 Tax=Salipiger pentaromativorans TaxID=2943193 RepID=UPI0021570A87|nr:Hint domain-containing protein [Salipiger pentaromativorans]MCR8547680.1 Hint domain-containing protein [Salipiger pentaromativorans]